MKTSFLLLAAILCSSFTGCYVGVADRGYYRPRPVVYRSYYGPGPVVYPRYYRPRPVVVYPRAAIRHSSKSHPPGHSKAKHYEHGHAVYYP